MFISLNNMNNVCEEFHTEQQQVSSELENGFFFMPCIYSTLKSCFSSLSEFCEVQNEHSAQITRGSCYSLML